MIPWHDPTSLGNLARIFAKCSEAHVAEALRRQATNPTSPLGACLVASGALTPHVVDWLVTKQKALRTKPSTHDVTTLLDYTIARLGEETAKMSVLVQAMQER